MTVLKSLDFTRFSGYVRETDTAVFLRSSTGGSVRINKGYLTLITGAAQALAGKLDPERVAPMTVRQIYYTLFSAGYIRNSKHDYRQVVQALVEGRKLGLISWGDVEDRLRVPRMVSMWDGVSNFMDTVKRAYRRDVWEDQDNYFELWVEKDALSGIFENVIAPYGVTLNVGRGYDGWTSIRNAAERFKARAAEGKELFIHYFGDFDPSGEDMVRSLRERLAFFGVTPELKKWAITREDIDTYNLPPAPGKESDSRSKAFEEEHGELIQVELDALPVLRRRITESVESTMNMPNFRATARQEKADVRRLADAVDAMEEE